MSKPTFPPHRLCLAAFLMAVLACASPAPRYRDGGKSSSSPTPAQTVSQAATPRPQPRTSGTTARGNGSNSPFAEMAVRRPSEDLNVSPFAPSEPETPRTHRETDSPFAPQNTAGEAPARSNTNPFAPQSEPLANGQSTAKPLAQLIWPQASPSPAPVSTQPSPSPIETPLALETSPSPRQSPTETVAKTYPVVPRVQLTPRLASRRPAPKRPAQPVYSREIADLAWNLTKDAQNDRDRAYALYEWLGRNITYDTKAYFSGNYGDNSPETVLRRKSGVCAGYANLFLAMADEIGLEAEIVLGHSKGYSFEPDQPDSSGSHAWNAVKIEGQWYLLDATWGAGNIDDNKQFVRNFTDQWFLTDPGIFIYSHLPEEPRWQLLEKPLDAQAFAQLPEVKPNYFSYGLPPAQAQQGQFRCQDRLVLQFDSSLGAVVRANLRQGERHLPLNTTFSIHEDGRNALEIRFPEPGTYEVPLFARLPHEKDSTYIASFRATASKAAPSLFPKAYGDYHKRGCRLLEGFNGKLEAGEPAVVKVAIPGASQAYVANGGERRPMDKSPDGAYRLQFRPEQGEVVVLAQFPGQSTLPYVLEYQAD